MQASSEQDVDEYFEAPVFGEVRATPITVNNDLVDEEQTDWLFFARASS